MPPHSLLLHSRSFRPLRNTFRSIDFAVDTQAVGTERRRSRKSARVKGGETGMRSAKGGEGEGEGGRGGEGRKREGEHIGRKGGKKGTLPRKRDREIKGLRESSAEQDRSEREGPKRKGETNGNRGRRKEERGRTKGRKKRGCWRPEVRETERRRGRPRSTTHLSTGLKNGSFAPASTTLPREPTPGRQPPLFFQRSFHQPPSRSFSSSCLPSPSSPSLPHIKHTASPGPPSVVFLSSSPMGKQIHPEGGGESHPAVVLARAAL